MSITELDVFLDRPCRFKLTSGKEIYGVIWFVNGQLLFASIEAYKKYSEGLLADNELSKLTHFSKENILGVELIPAMAS